MVSYSDNGGDAPSNDLEAMQRELMRLQDAYNNTPDAEMGSLSPAEVFELIHARWGDPDSAIKFNRGLGISEFASSRPFVQARFLLSALRDRGGLKATVNGRLPRAFLLEMLEADEMADETVRSALRSLKTFNEIDWADLHAIRIICQIAGLIRLYKGKLVVPKTRMPLLKEERAGELFGLLVGTCFQKFNLEYAYAGILEVPSMQSCLGYTVYRLGQVAATWCTIGDAYTEVFLPAVRAQLEQALGGNPYSDPRELAGYRILRPLVKWGLLELRPRETVAYRDWQAEDAVRVTQLYRAFLQFSLPPLC